MKILQVTTRYPPHTGGIETHVNEISERLVERGHDVTVLTADRRNGLGPTERRKGVTVHRHYGIAPGGAFHASLGMIVNLGRLDADLIHAHNYHSLPLLFAALARGNSRFVVTPHYHGASANPIRDRLLSAYRLIGRWALDAADEVIAVSEWERDRLWRDFDIEANTIPNGLDVERFQSAEPEERNGPYLLSVGRLEEYKGVQHLIRALTELPGHNLVIAGAGPYQDDLESLARSLGFRNRVVFLGYVDEERLPELYAGADAFVNLSKFEAYGMTIAEALSAGTPCVVRGHGGLSHWLGEEGCVGVASIEPSSVAAAVKSAIGSPVCSNAAPTWDEVTDRTVQLYQEITNCTRQP